MLNMDEFVRLMHHKMLSIKKDNDKIKNKTFLLLLFHDVNVHI